MSVISEIPISVSIVGSPLLVIYWLLNDRNREKLLLQIILHAALLLILHGISGFPRVLFRPQDPTISKGTGIPSPDWPINLIVYLAVVLATSCHYLYPPFGTADGQQPPFDVSSFITPLFISPIAFAPPCGPGANMPTPAVYRFSASF
jgi:hypothetical protein